MSALEVMPPGSPSPGPSTPEPSRPPIGPIPDDVRDASRLLVRHLAADRDALTGAAGAAVVACVGGMAMYALAGSWVPSCVIWAAAAVALVSGGVMLLLCGRLASEEDASRQRSLLVSRWVSNQAEGVVDGAGSTALDGLVQRIERMAGPARAYATVAAANGRARILRAQEEIAFLASGAFSYATHGSDGAINQLRDELLAEVAQAEGRLHELYVALVRLEVSTPGDATLEAAVRRLAAEIEVGRV